MVLNQLSLVLDQLTLGSRPANNGFKPANTGFRPAHTGFKKLSFPHIKKIKVRLLAPGECRSPQWVITATQMCFAA